VSVTGDGRTSVPPGTLQLPPSAVLLHGLFGDGDNLKGLAARLGDERATLRPHLPAHGDVPATSPLSFDAMADDLAARIHAQLAPDRAMHLIGHSLGGKVAMTLAARDDAFARRVRSLCVLDIGPKRYPPHHTGIIEALLALDTQGLASRREADTVLRQAIPEAGVRAFLLKALVRHDDGWRWRFDLDAIARDYATHLADAVPVSWPVVLPTLLLGGQRSDYLDSANRKAAADLFPQARIDTIADAGHWLHAEQPDAVAAAVLDHLRTVDAAA